MTLLSTDFQKLFLLYETGIFQRVGTTPTEQYISSPVHKKQENQQ